MRNLQKNLNKIWQTSRFTIPLFSNKNSRTPTPRPLHISINFEKVNPPFHLCRRRGGGRGPPTLICTKFHHYRIYVTGFKEEDLLPSPICEQPQKNPSGIGWNASQKIQYFPGSWTILSINSSLISSSLK